MEKMQGLKKETLEFTFGLDACQRDLAQVHVSTAARLYHALITRAGFQAILIENWQRTMIWASTGRYDA